MVSVPNHLLASPAPYSAPVTRAIEEAALEQMPDAEVFGRLFNPETCPYEALPHLAHYLGAYAFTEEFGEATARRLLGKDPDGNRYYYRLLETMGTADCLRWIGAPFSVTITALQGVFTKPDAADDSTWTLTQQTVPSTVRPTGIDVFINPPQGGLTTAHVAYFTRVIRESMPFWFVDIRVQVIARVGASMYFGAYVRADVDEQISTS